MIIQFNFENNTQIPSVKVCIHFFGGLCICVCVFSTIKGGVSLNACVCGCSGLLFCTACCGHIPYFNILEVISIDSIQLPCFFFNVYGSVHRESMPIIVQQDATMYSLLYFCKLLYMFRVVTPPIIRSTYNCNYSIWHWSNFRKCSV